MFEIKLKYPDTYDIFNRKTRRKILQLKHSLNEEELEKV